MAEQTSWRSPERIAVVVVNILSIAAKRKGQNGGSGLRN
jgi:hypothetical protein